MDRREFIKAGGGVVLAGASCAYAGHLLTTSFATGAKAPKTPSARKWGMVIDLTRCESGCTKCVDACREENNVAQHHDKRWTVHWLRKVKLKKKHGGGQHGKGDGKEVLLLCNHCDKPPCAQVCPVQATFKRDDGIVIVDHHRCIGCRYCMIACPYNARQFNFKETENWPNKDFPKRSHGVAEACTLCEHLLDKDKSDQKTACAAACPNGAIAVGDLNDSKSKVSQLIAEKSVKRIREDLGTEPKVYYVGL